MAETKPDNNIDKPADKAEEVIEPLNEGEKKKVFDLMKEVPKAERGKENAFKFKWKKGPLNQSDKKPDMIPVIYLNMKGGIEGPFLTKIYGGNFIVVKDMVYRYNPRKLWRIQKHNVGIIKAWDREMFGMEDFEQVVSQGATRTPLNDPVLIKALIQAKLAEKKSMDSKWIWIIFIIIGVAVAAMVFMKNKAPATTTTSTVPAAVPSGMTPAVPAG
jgi:hypothetical protein